MSDIGARPLRTGVIGVTSGGREAVPVRNGDSGSRETARVVLGRAEEYIDRKYQIADQKRSHMNGSSLGNIFLEANVPN